MCTALLPPGGYRIAVKEYIISYIINLIFMDPCIVVWFRRNNEQDAA
jgi:hypothetical protein